MTPSVDPVDPDQVRPHRRTLKAQQVAYAIMDEHPHDPATAERLVTEWFKTHLPADRILRYVHAGVTVREALDTWEPAHTADPDAAAASLEMLAGFRSTGDPLGP